VLGDVSAGDLVVYDGAEIQGTLRARGEMKLVQQTAGEGGESGGAEKQEADGTGSDQTAGDDAADASADGAATAKPDAGGDAAGAATDES